MALPRNPLDERLLAEGQALRALAASLLGRGDAADDAVQESYRLALAGRVTEVGYLPQWLRVTLRHLARGWRRGEVRRLAREQVAARGREAEADPAALAQQAELARDVAAAVHALEEPFRTVVVLRFWHGLLPEAIGAKLGVPRNTVRSRLQRGLERLRQRLDAKYGARERWSAPLMAFAGVHEVTATGVAAAGAVSWWTLGALMQIKMLAAAGLLAAAATFAFWPAGSVETGVESAARTVLASAAESGDLPQAPQRSPADESLPTAPAASMVPAAKALEPTPVKVDPWTAKVFVFDQHDRPVADAVVTTWALRPAYGHEMPGGGNAYSGREESPLSVVRTDVTGHVTIALDREAYEVEASKEEVGRSEAASLWFSHAAAKTTRMELLPPLFVKGRVVGVDGGPAADAEVTTEARPSTGLAVFRARPVPPLRTDAEGRFVVLVEKWVSYEFVAALDGKQTFRQKLFVTGGPLPEITLTFPGAITVSGLVVDAEGRPVPSAEVTAWRDIPPWDPEVGPRDAEMLTATADPAGRFVLAVRRHARYQVLAAAKDQATSELLWVETTVARPHADLRLSLPTFATIRGRVLHEDGSPFPGIKVLAAPEAGLWSGLGAVEKGPRPAQIDLFPKVKAATVAEDGSFTLTVHPGTTWTLSVRPVEKNWRMGIKQAGVAPGREDVVLTLTEADLAGCVVCGTVDAAFGLTGPFTVSIVDYGVDGKTNGSSDASARWDGNRFECPPLPRGQQFGIRVHEGTSNLQQSRPAEAFHGPFRTDCARLDVRIRLEQWGTLPVRVVGADDSPARRVKVVSHEVVPTSFGRGAAPVDGEGRIELTRLVPGAHRLMVFDDTGKLIEQEVTILSGPNAEIVIRLPAK